MVQFNLVFWSYTETAFCCWLAVKGRLDTHDRRSHWDPSLRCYLCGIQAEDHSHLFFNCTFSSQIWRLFQLKCGISIPHLDWFSLIGWLSLTWKDGSLSNVLSKICMATSVYYIWSERNLRAHSNNSNSATQTWANILELVTRKGYSLQGFPASSTNRVTQRKWNLPTSIFKASNV